MLLKKLALDTVQSHLEKFMQSYAIYCLKEGSAVTTDKCFIVFRQICITKLIHFVLLNICEKTSMKIWKIVWKKTTHFWSWNETGSWLWINFDTYLITVFKMSLDPVLLANLQLLGLMTRHLWDLWDVFQEEALLQVILLKSKGPKLTWTRRIAMLAMEFRLLKMLSIHSGSENGHFSYFWHFGQVLYIIRPLNWMFCNIKDKNLPI